jgi:outer membrane protein
MKWLFFILILTVSIHSSSLQSIIEHAQANNGNIQAKRALATSKRFEVEAKKRDFFPTLDLGGSYSKNAKSSFMSADETTTGYIKVGIELYDGGRKGALKRAKEHEYRASLFEQKAFAKSVTLDIINQFYTLKKHKANLEALYQQSKELYEQIKRVQHFKTVGLAIASEIDRLQAAYDNNVYNIEATKFAIATALEQLSLQSGQTITRVKDNVLKTPKGVKFEPYENIKIMQSNIKSLHENVKAIDSGTLPSLRVDNTYGRSIYEGFSENIVIPANQNTLQLSLNWRLFDGGKRNKEREALQYQKLALQSDAQYALNEQKMNFKLANKQLKTIRTQIQSTKSRVQSTKSNYASIKDQYTEGLVDYVTYLDALSSKSEAYSSYKLATYDYEIAKSVYYYYAGKDPKEFIQ